MNEDFWAQLGTAVLLFIPVCFLGAGFFAGIASLVIDGQRPPRWTWLGLGVFGASVCGVGGCLIYAVGRALRYWLSQLS